METNQYLSMFIDESKEHLQAMNENLLELEKSPADINIVQNIFRSAHTLKGMSATMGFEDLASLTHEMENVLDLVRNHKLSMEDFIFDAIFKSLDSLEEMVQDVVEGGDGKKDVQEIVTALQNIVTGKAQSQAGSSGGSKSAKNAIELDQYQFSVLTQSLHSDHFVYYIEVLISETCVLKAARAYMVFDTLERNGEVVKSSPSVEEIEQEKFDRTFAVYYITKIHTPELEQLILNISEVESVKLAQVDEETLKQLIQKQNTREDQPKASAPAARENKETAVVDKTTGNGQTKQSVGGRTIRVDIERLDTLMNLFSELLIDRVRLEQLASEVKMSELTETVEHMTRVSSDLQNLVLKLRMVPVDTVFNRFPRMIRDLAKNLDKKIELVITGADTELDRTVIDEIGDPLVHLLRNALDHGLEPTVERIAVGKPETGTVHLSAFHSGNHVFIEIEDDGAGINREKVLKTAIKNKIVTQEQAKAMTDNEVYQLLFASGFSTADHISDISGRGVGLDVVQTKIAKLGGNVSVDSTPGKGTKFSVQLPLTLSIIAAMLIKLRDEKFAIPLSSIVETALIPVSDLRKVHGMNMVHYRDNVIPIYNLSEVLDVPQRSETESETADNREFNVVIIRKGDKLAALEVDELIGQQEIVLKALGDYLKRIFAVSGATILGDGQVALILDPNALIK